MQYTRYWLDNGTLLSEAVEYEPSDTLAEQAGRAETYAMEIRGFARAVWQGLPIEVHTSMWDTVFIGITTAWRQGAASCGISEEELTFEEKTRLDAIIREQQSHIFGFLAWVHEHRRDGPDKFLWRVIVSRAAMWGNAWNRAYNESAMRACADRKLAWQLHGKRITKKPCGDCLKLNGRVHRASVWAKYDIYPQSPNLECHGLRCGCGWREVGPPYDRATPGRPPRLAGQR